MSSRYKMKCIYVQYQHVATVKNIDLNITQTNLIAGIDDHWAQEATDLGDQKVNHASESTCPGGGSCMFSVVLMPGARAESSGTWGFEARTKGWGKGFWQLSVASVQQSTSRYQPCFIFPGWHSPSSFVFLMARIQVPFSFSKVISNGDCWHLSEPAHSKWYLRLMRSHPHQ